MTTRELLCCCGRACDNTARNYAILEGLERDVHEAGTIGQALLQRYEEHIVQSSREQEKLTLAMELLEDNKSALEASNAKMILENRALLDQLEELNSSITDSDVHISTLNETLNTTRQELQKLSSLAQKATQLERELSDLELERAQLDTELAVSQEDKQAAMQRWKRAESTIALLQDQLDVMDRDANEQRQKNKQTEAQMARLSVGIGETQPACQPQSVDSRSTSRDESVVSDGGVVSHFVKEILEDNSNLQLGLLELKEMLLASSSEVKTLRAQLDLSLDNYEDSQLPSQSLQAELYEVSDGDGKLETVPELHVHHHYHQQKQHPRRPRRRRFNQMTQLNRSGRPALQQANYDAISGRDGIISGFQADRASTLGHHGHYPRTSVYSVGTESSYTASSFSTSPRGMPSVFDSVENVFDSTRATTPASSAPGSPLLSAHRRETLEQSQGIAYDNQKRQPPPLHQPDILNKVTDIVPKAQVLYSVSVKSNDLMHRRRAQEVSASTRLRRSSSQDSLLSISGMDIHTTQNYHTRLRHSSNLLLDNKKLLPTLTSATLSPATAVSQAFELGVSNDRESSTSLLLHQIQARQHDQGTSSLRRMGNWVFGRRGRDPSPMDNPDISASTKYGDDAPAERDPVSGFRSPGINQPGPIFGMLKPHPAPTNVRPTDIDSSLLHETLQGAL